MFFADRFVGLKAHRRSLSPPDLAISPLQPLLLIALFTAAAAAALSSSPGADVQRVPCTSETIMDDSNGTLYFAFGSNLSPTQMHARCPQSKPVGLAHLPHPWEWLINERGYANIVNKQRQDKTKDSVSSGAVSPAALEGSGSSDGPGVYGVLYTLPPEDEKTLDRYEGVPHAYEKVILPLCLVLPGQPDAGNDAIQTKKEVPALVYVDFKRTDPARPKDEYILRMNRAIHEAREGWGLPREYIDEVMRPFVPEGGWDGAGIAPK